MVEATAIVIGKGVTVKVTASMPILPKLSVAKIVSVWLPSVKPANVVFEVKVTLL